MQVNTCYKFLLGFSASSVCLLSSRTEALRELSCFHDGRKSRTIDCFSSLARRGAAAAPHSFLSTTHPLQRTADPADRQHDDELSEANLVVAAALEVLQALVDVGVLPLVSEVHGRLVEALLELVLGDVSLVAVVDALKNRLDQGSE